MKHIKIIAIIGTRPQYIKHAAFCAEVRNFDEVELITLDTGQHYDQNMSEIFVEDFKIDNIKYNLDVKSGLHGEQTGKMLGKIEDILIREEPDYVLVYGDTNSTMAGALAAAKLKIKVVHIEAGMRNFNIQIPEEINRVVTDRVSTYKIAASQVAFDNLVEENLKVGTYLFGDITTDLLFRLKNTAIEGIGDKYFCTIHRPYNTNEKSRLHDVLKAVNSLDNKVILPLHPRTNNAMKNFNLAKDNYPNIEFIAPVSFFETVKYVNSVKCVITDSGGVQRESYIMGKQCISILPSTPWIETLEGNWNQLVFNNLDQLQSKINSPADQSLYKAEQFGDGQVARKIIELLIRDQ